MNDREHNSNHALTRIGQLECFLGLDEVVPVIFQTSELPFKDGQHVCSIVRSKVTLQERNNPVMEHQLCTKHYIGQSKGMPQAPTM